MVVAFGVAVVAAVAVGLISFGVTILTCQEIYWSLVCCIFVRFLQYFIVIGNNSASGLAPGRLMCS